MKIKIIFPSEDVIGKVIFLGGLNLYNWIKSKDHAINVKSLLISQILLLLSCLHATFHQDMFSNPMLCLYKQMAKPRDCAQPVEYYCYVNNSNTVDTYKYKV